MRLFRKLNRIPIGSECHPSVYSGSLGCSTIKIHSAERRAQRQHASVLVEVGQGAADKERALYPPIDGAREVSHPAVGEHLVRQLSPPPAPEMQHDCAMEAGDELRAVGLDPDIARRPSRRLVLPEGSRSIAV